MGFLSQTDGAYGGGPRHTIYLGMSAAASDFLSKGSTTTVRKMQEKQRSVVALLPRQVVRTHARAGRGYVRLASGTFWCGHAR